VAWGRRSVVFSASGNAEHRFDSGAHSTGPSKVGDPFLHEHLVWQCIIIKVSNGFPCACNVGVDGVLLRPRVGAVIDDGTANDVLSLFV